MSGDDIATLIDIGLLVLLLILGFSIGTITEKRHYRSIKRREKMLSDIMIFAVRTPPPFADNCKTTFVTGSVVIGMDYFKKTLAYFRNIFGGRMGSYETLLDRARREAILRMKEQARAKKAKAILNVKFSTANIMSGDNKKTMGCVEVIAYGTAVIPKKR